MRTWRHHFPFHKVIVFHLAFPNAPCLPCVLINYLAEPPPARRAPMFKAIGITLCSARRLAQRLVKNSPQGCCLLEYGHMAKRKAADGAKEPHRALEGTVGRLERS